MSQSVLLILAAFSRLFEFLAVFKEIFEKIGRIYILGLFEGEGHDSDTYFNFSLCCPNKKRKIDKFFTKTFRKKFSCLWPFPTCWLLTQKAWESCAVFLDNAPIYCTFKSLFSGTATPKKPLTHQSSDPKPKVDETDLKKSKKSALLTAKRQNMARSVSFEDDEPEQVAPTEPPEPSEPTTTCTVVEVNKERFRMDKIERNSIEIGNGPVKEFEELSAV